MEQGERLLEPETIVTAEWERVVLPHVPEELHAAAKFFLDATLQAYSETDRYYHDLTHIVACQNKLAPYRDREDYLQLFLAVLWHDLIYDTKSKTNEEDSANEASAMIEHLELPGAETVSRLIISTKEHAPQNEDEQLVCAIDVSILAEPWDVYQCYAVGIRAEYTTDYGGPYTWEQYAAGRRDVLKHLTEGPGPFRHPDFEHLNPRAIKNMKHEIALL